MKKTLNIFLSMLMVAAITASFTGCGGGEEDPIPPTVSVSQDVNDAWRADTVTFTIQMSTNEKLAELEISSDFTTQNATITEFTGTNSATHVYTFVVPGTVSDGDYITITFKVTDNKGEFTTKTANINVNEPGPIGTTLEYENTTGVVWNLIGPNQGAWDLVANTGLSSSAADANKDMKNTTTVSTGWTNAWTAANATMFVKANSFDYAAGTLEDATTAYGAGTATGTVSDPAVNDIYIAKLRGGTNYVVIKVTGVTVTASDNLDKISFSYKKVAATTGS
ncbi:MAG: hypothetical protein JXR58_00920 [Bacteroidales bacterium]|nr:hypothetical protein [Bacteroidales bacterium]